MEYNENSETKTDIQKEKTLILDFVGAVEQTLSQKQPQHCAKSWTVIDMYVLCSCDRAMLQSVNNETN